MAPYPRAIDPRRQRTLDALHGAFLQVAQQHRYDDIRIDDVLRVSGVGRSTFYEHFRGKDALLVSCMDDALRLLAGLAFGTSALARVEALLAHFRDRRMLARGLFQGRSLARIRVALVRVVETELHHRQAHASRIPHRLAACAIADALLSPVIAWLAGEAACDHRDLAAALRDASRAMVDGLYGSPRDHAGG